MSGINQGVITSISMIRVTFGDNLNPPKIIVGTGFWVKSERNKTLFITNKHNVDPKLMLGEKTKYTLQKVEIQFRKIENNLLYSDTNFYSVQNIDCILLSQSADCAILAEPQFTGVAQGFSHGEITQIHIADHDFLTNKTNMMDIVSFIGFPGSKGASWWDETWNLPIARTANIASLPSIPLANRDIVTSDIALVSGLSFAGSSGSPIILHQKGIAPGDIIDRNYVPPKVLGIMSGHWKDSANEVEMFNHSGLSYFTRSTSILELVASHQL